MMSISPDEGNFLIHDILDKGKLGIVSHMGNDESIVNAARISYQKSTEKVRDSDRLIRYLWKNKHTSPFEHVVFTLYVKAPIFVIRQWQRHRTQSYNEESLRYSESKLEMYVPAPDRLGKQSKDNKQGTDSDSSYNDEEISNILNTITMLNEDASMSYKKLLEQHDLSRELARMVLPVNTYSSMYVTVNLLNLLKFIQLRDHSHAQYEVRCYANMIRKMLYNYVPETMKVFDEDMESDMYAFKPFEYPTVEKESKYV